MKLIYFKKTVMSCFMSGTIVNFCLICINVRWMHWNTGIFFYKAPIEQRAPLW